MISQKPLPYLVESTLESGLAQIAAYAGGDGFERLFAFSALEARRNISHQLIRPPHAQGINPFSSGRSTTLSCSLGSVRATTATAGSVCWYLLACAGHWRDVDEIAGAGLNASFQSLAVIGRRLAADQIDRRLMRLVLVRLGPSARRNGQQFKINALRATTRRNPAGRSAPACRSSGPPRGERAGPCWRFHAALRHAPFPPEPQIATRILGTIAGRAARRNEPRAAVSSRAGFWRSSDIQELVCSCGVSRWSSAAPPRPNTTAIPENYGPEWLRRSAPRWRRP